MYFKDHRDAIPIGSSRGDIMNQLLVVKGWFIILRCEISTDITSGDLENTYCSAKKVVVNGDISPLQILLLEKL